MKRAILLLTAAAAVLVAGCGSGNKEIDQVRAEQKRGLKQMREQVQVLSRDVRRLHEDVRELESDLYDMRDRLESARS
jgi:outer membrane murein-binding lipoprotein Lpp